MATTLARFAFLVALALALVVLTFGVRAHANMAKWWHEGEGHGPLVPRNDADVGVDSEDLVFEVAPSLDRAAVTATYRMTHAGGSPTTAEVAFVVLEDERPSHRDGAPQATITIDGAPVSYRVLDIADVLEPLLDRWSEAHPDATCPGDCSSLQAWGRTKRSREEWAVKLHREEALPAARSVIPEEVTKLYADWSKLPGDRPLHWLLFEIPFPAGASRTVTVAYEHFAGSDARRGVDDLFLYDYLLSPASRWAHFGGLHVSVHVPPKTLLRASLPLARKDERSGAIYETTLPKLPPGELSLELMSLAHVPFGMTHPAAYWVLLLATMMAVTFATGRAIGRRLAGASSRWRIAGSILIAGPLVLLATGAVLALATFVAPPHAFGFGYEAMFGLLLTIAFFTVTGIAVSRVSAR